MPRSSQNLRSSQVPLETANEYEMRRVLLIPAGASPVDPGLACLLMNEYVWESGYPLIVGKTRQGLLQEFWRHYYGASAEMFVPPDQLLELHNDIMAAIPCAPARCRCCAFSATSGGCACRPMAKARACR